MIENKFFRFQLVSPIVGEKIYQTNSAKAGFKKCYEELKAFGLKNYKEFSVMDINTYKTFKFAIRHNKIQIGSGNENKNIDDQSKNSQDTQEDTQEEKNIEPAEPIDNKINELENTIKLLTEKISIIENKLNLSNDIPNNDSEKSTNIQEGCNINLERLRQLKEINKIENVNDNQTSCNIL